MIPADPDEATLALLAEGVLGASDEEILRVAVENGVDVATLTQRVRAMAAARAAGFAEDQFAAGDAVCLRSDPSRVGVVTGVLPGNRATRYNVFLAGRVETLYGSQLVRADLSRRTTTATLDELAAKLTALQIASPGLANLYSLQAGRIDFIPHQFRPVLKFVRADRPRLLIADEVGVGKTIEAGLLLRELQARRPLRSVLIVCSKALVAEKKWEREMRRFDEEFVALSSSDLRHCLEQTDLDGEWPERFARAIVPFSLFNENLLQGFPARGGARRGPGLASLDPPPRFDLLIVDEAHNARNADTSLHQGLRILADNAEAVVFLTATPVQMGTGDLFSLLNLLRPDLVIDRPTFERMASPNAAINAAVAAMRRGADGWREEARGHLQEAAATDWGARFIAPSPEFRALLAAVAAAEGVEDRVLLIGRAEALHSFASMISRTRRRDIGTFTTRKPQTVAVDFTEEQRAVHDAVLAVQRAAFLREGASAPIGFLMTTIRRQASSSLHGLVPLMEAILERRLSAAEGADLGGEAPDAEAEELRRLARETLDSVRALPAEDPKLARLLAIVREKAALPNPRLLIFSSFRHTLAYLEAALRREGVRVGMVHGDVPDDERRTLRQAFALPSNDPDALDVLLSSEVGSEGLDFQFCDALVNYDIPWNPMRIEQRIGRIDRYGQASETVAIYNFVTPGTVDFDVYNRCLLRIGVFERSVGGSEAILGDLAAGLQRVADDFSLTEEERAERLRQLADNEVRAVAEADILEERQAELFGIVAGNKASDEVAAASSRWLEPAALERLVGLHLERALGMGRSPLQGQGSAKTLRLSSDARRRLISTGRQHRSLRASLAEREWEAWLKGEKQTLALTFDRDAANKDRSLALITPTHPLAQAAAQAFAGEEEVVATLAASAQGFRPDAYPFAIYLWQISGLRDDAMLVPVVADDELGRSFMEVLAGAQDVVDASPPDGAAIEALESWHHDLWVARRARHMEETAEIARFRRDSLDASHRARVAVLSEQLAAAGEERIRRMRQGQMARAASEHADALAALSRDEARADIVVRRIATGVLVLEG